MQDSSRTRLYDSHPLDHHRLETRLVTILHGNFADDVNCSLKRVDLDSKPVYEALSYEWGSPEPKAKIQIDGCLFEVTPNLGAALRYLRSPREDRVVWIDAICINQSDMDERAAQVRMMSSVYSGATRVVAWLGEQVASDLEGGLQAIRRIKALEAPSLTIEYESDSFKRAFLHDLLKQTQNLRAILACLGYDECGAVPSYWTRIWITQEITLANSLLLQSKHVHILESDVYKFVSLYSAYSALALQFVTAERYAAQREMLRIHAPLFELVVEHRQKMRRSIRGEKSGLQLLDLLRTCRKYEATDPRDHVYALLGLCEPKTGSRIHVRYDAPVHVVFTEAFKAIVDLSSRLDVLCLTVLGAANPEFALPSFVPDWSPYFHRQKTSLPDTNYRDRAAGESQASVKFRIEDSSQVLTTSGFRLGAVTAMTWVARATPLAARGDLETMHECLRDIMRGYSDLAAVAGPNLTAASYVECLVELTELSSGHWTGTSNLTPILAQALEMMARGDLDEAIKNYLTQEHRRYEGMAVHTTLIMEVARDYASFLLDPVDPSSSSKEAVIGMGLVVERGDLVCLFLGCPMPVLIRPKGRFFQFVGPVRIQQFMDGKAMDDFKNGLYTLESFDLV